MTDTTTVAAHHEWARPGCYEVEPGVYRIPLPLPMDGLRAVNAYVLAGPDGVEVIDSGWAHPASRDALMAALKKLDVSASDIRRFLVTHVHRDHYEQAVVLREEFGIKVALGAGERPAFDALELPDYRPFGEQVRQLRAHGANSLADAMVVRFGGHIARRSELERPDEWLHEGQVSVAGGRTLDVVPTPGHTQGHVVFIDEQARLLFAGDHVLPTITPSIGFETAVAANPLGDYVKSLAAIRARPDARLLPAHGAVTESAHVRIDELIEHHGGRLRQAEVALVVGASCGHEVAAALTWTRRNRKLEELDEMDQALAVIETGAHLDLLVAQGRASVRLEDGVRRYWCR